MKFSHIVAAMVALVVPATAQAGVYVFNGVCTNASSTTQATCTSTNGSYGNTVTINSTTDATLSMKVSGWQMNQTTNAITSAFLGAYSHGFGVTGVQDQNGANNLHQIDNVNGYTDFVILQFNRSVHLDGVNAYAFGINGAFDADASFSNGAGIAPAVWNAAMNLSSYSGTWSTTAVNGQSGQFSTSITDNATGFSKVWLVSASMLTPDRDDGFKLTSITVSTPAVPEPATWAMLIMGFGAIGATLRRRAVAGTAVTA
ncbi:MAG: PEP-CTERM sorting domain-containing protein [Proteobacteria bacterium]|nr:PEP-CTERM sorting domain-containing protein [Pseudomonadota bacterium]